MYFPPCSADYLGALCSQSTVRTLIVKSKTVYDSSTVFDSGVECGLLAKQLDLWKCFLFPTWLRGKVNATSSTVNDAYGLSDGHLCYTHRNGRDLVYRLTPMLMVDLGDKGEERMSTVVS